MKVYALTGGVACGKSTAVETFKQQENVVVLDSDEITRILQEPGQPGFIALQRRFPSVIVKNKLDRQKLADIVFEQSENGEIQRKILNGIMQPLITKYIFTELISLWFSHVVCNIFSFSQQKSAARELVVIVDAPVFFEMEKRIGKFLMRMPFSAVIVVSTSEEIQRQRLQARGQGCSEQEAKKRIAAQLPLAEKEKLADYVIRNDGTEDELKAKVAGVIGGLIEKLRREHGSGGILSSGFNRFALVSGIALSAVLIGSVYVGYVYVWPHFLTIIHALNLMYGLFF